MKNLPLPSTVTGWWFAIILIILSFALYYFFLFDEVNSKYYSSFRVLNSSKITDKLPKGMEITVQIPETVARFDARELQVKASANENIAIRDVKIMIESKGKLLFCAERPILFSGCYQSWNVLQFGDFEQGDQKMQSTWVILAPRITSRQDDSIPLSFKITYGSRSSIDIPFDAGSITVTEGNNISTLQSFILGTLLLPPWSNGLIPSIALLIVYLFEHKIQPNQRFSEKTEKWLQVRKRFQWLRNRARVVSFILIFLLHFALYSVLFGMSTNQYKWTILGILLFFITFLAILYFIGNTDISQGDPLYTKSISNPPSSGNSNLLLSEVSSTLTRMNATLEGMSKINQTDADRLVQKLDGLADTLSKIEDVVAAELAKKLERLTDVLQQQKDTVHEEMQKMSRILEKQREIGMNRSSPLDNPYSHLSLLRDDGLVALFKKELPGLSEQQFKKKLEEREFSWCILSLLVRAHKEKWDDNLLIAHQTLRRWIISEPLFWKDETAPSIFKQWLADLHKQDSALFEYAIPIVLDWMLRFKKDQVEKYLFDVFPEKCPPKAMVTLLAEYLESYQNEGEKTNIRWDKVLDYFLNADKPTELISDVGRVWYPLKGASSATSLWEMVRQNKGEFSLQRWKQIYTTLLDWLCSAPDEVVQRVAQEIYQFYKDDKSLEQNSQLAQFVQKIHSSGEISNSHILKIVKDWCQHR